MQTPELLYLHSQWSYAFRCQQFQIVATEQNNFSVIYLVKGVSIQKKLTIMQICEETCRNIFPEELTQLIIDCWEDIIKEPGELLFCSVDDLIFGLKHIRLFKNQNS